MSWCPKCRLEYRDGIFECAECKVPLVSWEELSEEKVLLCSYETEDVLNRMNEYFRFSGIESGEVVYGTEIVDDDPLEGWHLKVSEKDLAQARTRLQAFMLGEMERKKELEEEVKNAQNGEAAILGSSDTDSMASQTEASDMDRSAEGFDETEGDDGVSFGNSQSDAAQDYVKERLSINEQTAKLRATDTNATYVKQEDRYRDYNSTGYTFVVMGVFGVVFMALSWAKVIGAFRGNLIAQVVFSVISIGCIIIGIQSLSKARYLKKEIGSEEDLTKRIIAWMDANIVKEELMAVCDPGQTEEINYFNQINLMKQQLMEEFGDENDAYLDQLIEDYYNSHF